jgi:hypothetical protein
VARPKRKTRVIYLHKAQEARKSQADYRGPTDQRVRAAAEFYVVGNEKQGPRRITMQDSPLDRLWARQRIDPVSYSALQRYHLHWYHGGLQASLGSADLNRVFASDPGSMSGMAKSERQYNHRDQWRKAREELGHRPGIIVDNIVCAEWSLEIAGYSIGYTSPYRARQGAKEILLDAGHRLAKMWGIG